MPTGEFSPTTLPKLGPVLENVTVGMYDGRKSITGLLRKAAQRQSKSILSDERFFRRFCAEIKEIEESLTWAIAEHGSIAVSLHHNEQQRQPTTKRGDQMVRLYFTKEFVRGSNVGRRYTESMTFVSCESAIEWVRAVNAKAGKGRRNAYGFGDFRIADHSFQSYSR